MFQIKYNMIITWYNNNKWIVDGFFLYESLI